MTDGLTEQIFEHAPVTGDNRAVIGKRQGHTPFAGQQTVDPHDGQKPQQFTGRDDGKVYRLVSVGVVQHPCPPGGVEKTALRVGEEQVVPAGILRWVDDLDIRFVHK